MYQEERNYGCRYQEISIYGYRSLVLENELLRITMILGKGCEIVEFNYKKIDMDFVWRSPQGLRSLKNYNKNFNDDLVLTDYYTGGWYDTFPSCGGRGKYNSATLPIYGEACYLPWEYEVIKDSSEEVIIKAYCNTIRSPFYFEKFFKIISSDPTLYIKTAIENISRQKAYFDIGYHPNFGRAFIDDEIEIEFEGCNIEVPWAEENSRFKEGQKGKWPLLRSKDGKNINLKFFPGPDSGINEVLFLNELSAGVASILNKNKSIGIKITWDLKLYRNAVLWMVRYGDAGYPRYGNTNVLCIMPSSAKYRDSIKENDLIYIEPQEKITTWTNFEVIHP